MLELFPNGTMILTGMSSMMGHESTDDPIYNWFTRKWPARVGKFDNLYTTVSGTTAFSGATTLSQGRSAFVRIAGTNREFAKELRNGHMVTVGSEAQHATFEYVGQSVEADGDIRLHVKLLSSTKTGANLGSINSNTTKSIGISGSASAVGADRPPPTTYDPVLETNYTQIFREAIVLPRTTAKMNLRSRDPYRDAVTMSLSKHGENMEKSLLFGEKYIGVGDNGLEKYFTEGIVPWLDRRLSDNIVTFSGTWNTAGEGWMDENLVEVFRFGGMDRMCVGGAKAIQAISSLVKELDGSRFVYESRTDSYGIKVMEWRTTQGTIYLKTHPLFTNDPILETSLLTYDPMNVRAKVMLETMHVPSPPNNRIDLMADEEFKTEMGHEFHHPETFMLMKNVGG